VLKVKTISTGNEELDNKIGGGLPFPALIVVEGGHGSGKSVLVQQFIYGALKSNLRVIVVTTENTSIGYVRGMVNVGFDIIDFYLRGHFTVYSTQIPRVKWIATTSRDLLSLTLKHMISTVDKYDMYAIDSFSVLVRGSTSEDITNFITIAKRIVDKGKLIILTLHLGDFTEQLHSGLKAMADGYIEVKNVEMGGRLLKVMNIIKLKGAPTVFENSITFEVDPAFGIKLVPMALAKI